MTTLQIVLLSISGAFALVSLVFMILFLVEISVGAKEEKETEVKSIFSSESYVKETKTVETVDSMLAKLDAQAQEGEKEEKKAIEIPVEVVEKESKVETVVEEKSEPKEESKVVENVEKVEVASTEEIKEVIVEEVKEEKKEEVVDTPVEEVVEEVKEEVVETPAEESVEVDAVTVDAVPVVTEPITAANLLDYKARLENVIASRDKLNKDLIKIEKSILNYERTKRRKIRNQKMLDRRASELTNLNLVMYSVTDIKNVDEEKKIKQEELTTHIAELKASIQDADEFLDSNKEKNEHDIKMAKFLIKEKARFKEEIAELEDLIAKTEGAGTAATV